MTIYNHPKLPVAMIPSIDRYNGVRLWRGVIGTLSWGFSLSQANSKACLSKYYLRHIQGLRPGGSHGFTLATGTGWHRIMDSLREVQIEHGDKVKPTPSDAWRVFATVDEDTEAKLRSLTDAYLDYWGSGYVQAIESPDRATIVKHAADFGWSTTPQHQGNRKGVELVAVATEIQIAVPIGDPVELPVAVDPNGVVSLSRPTRGGEVRVFQPHFLCTFDGVYVEVEDHKRVWLGEYKSAGDAQKKADSLCVDTQTRAYQWALQHAISEGLIPNVDTGASVVGLYYDVVSSGKITPPKLLAPKKAPILDENGEHMRAIKESKIKVLDENGEPVKKGRKYVYETDEDGNHVMLRERTGPLLYETDEDGEHVMRSQGFSSISTTGTPKMWRDAIEKHGFKASDYREQLARAEQKQIARFVRVFEFGLCHRKMERVEREIMDHLDTIVAMQLGGSFPRNPSICDQYSGCGYTGPCAAGRGFSVETPEGYSRRLPKWYPEDKFETIAGSGVWPKTTNK